MAEDDSPEDGAAAAEEFAHTRKPRRVKGKTPEKRRLDQETRARWMNQLRIERPTFTREAIVKQAMRHFDINRRTADDAYSLGAQILREAWKEGDPEQASKVAAMFEQLYEAAFREKKYAAAARAAESYAKMLGLGAPDRMRVELPREAAAMPELTTEELEVLAKARRLAEAASPSAESTTEH